MQNRPALGILTAKKVANAIPPEGKGVEKAEYNLPVLPEGNLAPDHPLGCGLNERVPKEKETDGQVRQQSS